MPAHQYKEFREPPIPDDIITNMRLANKPYLKSLHHPTALATDKVAYALVKLLRVPADLFFSKKYGHRAIVLETVAAVPGMVAGVMRHLRSLRRMSHDGGWIPELLDEAENERMHLLTFLKIQRPSLFERIVVASTQAVFFNLYFFAYMLSPRTAHRFVGYLEEEAIVSYTQYLEQIDKGHIENVPAPQMAIEYWQMSKDARLRDVVIAVRADEARHRDVNHRFADAIMLDQKPMLSVSVPLKREQF
jgi:ubiquinol oxidase